MNSLEQEINRLEQICIEDEYSRKNIREKVIEDIMTGIDTNMRVVFQKCVIAIDKYMCGEYYASKQARIQCIAHIPSSEIAAEIFMAVIPLKKETVIQGTAHKLGVWLEYQDIFDGVKTGAELLGMCVDSGLYDINAANSNGLPHLNIKSLYSLDPSTQQFIDNTQYLNPMITPPDDWSTNTIGGYISVRQSLLLGKGNHHYEEQALDAINIIQKIEWKIDEDVLALVEQPKEKLDTKEKMDNFNQMKLMTQATAAELLKLSETFWLVWRPDFRGRFYSQGHWLNFQSSSYRKALFNLANEEVITC